jgi:uncharacterized 2Fe-2S/4Fe-4S cluster protein (DUF4445 family)
VTPAYGTFAKHGITSAPDHLTEPNAVETAYREEQGLAVDRRLSCTACVLGDAVIDVPPESQVHRQVVRKELAARAFEMDPVLRLHTVDVTEPDIATPTGDLGRLFDALGREWGLAGLRADLHVVQELQQTLTEGDYRVTVAVHGGHDVIAIWPGYNDRAYGVAIDVGSTTIAGHLVDLSDGSVIASAGTMNPQIRFGEDLMSRVSVRDDARGGDEELTGAVRKAIDGLLANLANKAFCKTRRDPRAHDRREPDHAPPPAGHRPDPARFGALRRWPSTPRSRRPPPSSVSAPTRGLGSTCSRASPGTSVPTRPA